MDNYITGTTIKRLREAKGITQSRLAEQIGVSGKAVFEVQHILAIVNKTTFFFNTIFICFTYYHNIPPFGNNITNCVFCLSYRYSISQSTIL